MFEHVGLKNYRTYFEVARACLPDDGLFLLHTIGSNVSAAPHRSVDRALHLPQFDAALGGADRAGGRGAVRDRGLARLRHRLRPYTAGLARQRRSGLGRVAERYDERFRRMWRFYSAASMASFRARRIQLWQVVLSPRGVRGGWVEQR